MAELRASSEHLREERWGDSRGEQLPLFTRRRRSAAIPSATVGEDAQAHATSSGRCAATPSQRNGPIGCDP